MSGSSQNRWPIMIGQRAAIFGLMLAGVGFRTACRIMRVSEPKMRVTMPEKWVLPTQGRLDHGAILTFYKKHGGLVKTTAAYFDAAPNTISRILCAHGLRVRDKGIPWRAFHRKRVDLYLAGLSEGLRPVEAAARADCSYRQVADSAKRIGVKLASGKMWRKARDEKIAATYRDNANMTQNAVAERLGISPSLVYLSLKKTGTPSRGRSKSEWYAR